MKTPSAREVEKAAYVFRRALGDFAWKNCSHSTGESIPDWLVCWRCVQAFIEERDRARQPEDVEREPDECDSCANPMDGNIAATSDVCLDCWNAAKEARAEVERLRGELAAVIENSRSAMQAAGESYVSHDRDKETLARLRTLLDEGSGLVEGLSQRTPRGDLFLDWAHRARKASRP